MVVCVVLLGAVMPSALAAPTAKYKFITVDGFPGTETVGGNLATYVSDGGIIFQWYIDANSYWHTVALVNRKWVSLDVPGYDNTGSGAAHTWGQIPLTSWGADGVAHLAIWSRGQLTKIADPCPGYVFAAGQSINDLGQVTSICTDANGVGIVYVSASQQHLFFPVPSATFAYPGASFTFEMGSNDLGTAVGAYWDAEGVQHGFAANVYDGTYRTIDIPGETNTWVQGINDEGAMVGSAMNSGGYWVGFEFRGRHQESFNVPDALASDVFWITNGQKVSGAYEDASGLWHGFVAIPVSKPEH
jgi:hypothetical protein